MPKKKKSKAGRKPRTGKVFTKGITVYAAEEARPDLYRWLMEQPQDRLWYHVSLAVEEWLKGGVSVEVSTPEIDDTPADDEQERKEAAKNMLKGLGGI